MTPRREHSKGDLPPGNSMRKRQMPPPACPQEPSPGWARVPLREPMSWRKGLEGNPEKTLPSVSRQAPIVGRPGPQVPQFGTPAKRVYWAKESSGNCRAVETVENQLHLVPTDSARGVCPPFPQRLENSFGRSFPPFPQLLRLVTSQGIYSLGRRSPSRSRREIKGCPCNQENNLLSNKKRTPSGSSRTCILTNRGRVVKQYVP